MKVLTALVGVLLLSVGSAEGTVVRVPLDQPSISEGIGAASPGDTVLIASGTYTGSLNRDMSFGGKDLIVVSEAGAELTIIDCEGVDRAFDIGDSETAACVVEGLTITGGYAYSYNDCGGGVRIRGASPTIRGCVFSYCHAEGDWWYHFWPAFGGAIYCEDSSTAIVGCTFVGNTVNGDPAQGSAIAHYGPGGVVSNCLFADNAGSEHVDTITQAISVYHCVSDSWLPQEEDNAAEADPGLCGGLPPSCYFPCSDSPALPLFNDWDELVGVFEAGCGPCATAVESMTWGSIKAMYR